MAGDVGYADTAACQISSTVAQINSNLFGTCGRVLTQNGPAATDFVSGDAT